jgi:hypothetical protein
MKNTIIGSIDVPMLAKEINQGMQTKTVEANGAESSPKVQNSDCWEEVITKVLGFRGLGDDWDGLGARVPDPVLVESAVLFAQLGLQAGMTPPSVVVPGLDGCVIFEWQKVEAYMEVEICKPGCAEFMKVILDHPAEHKVIAY